MADYYPLLARALDGLAESTPEGRRAVYERAETALLSQLRSLQPPLSAVEIDRERASLADAVARAEAAYGRPAAAPEPPEPERARRPRVEPQPAIRKGGRRGRPLLVAVALAGVIGPIAAAAWWWREAGGGGGAGRAPATAAAPPRPAPSVAEGKIADRVSSGPGRAEPPTAAPPAVARGPEPPRPAEPSRPAEPARSAEAPRRPEPPASGPDLAVAQRAVMIEENPADPQNPKITAGRALWRLDATNPGQGQPLETVVRATVEAPEEGLTLQLAMRRNLDSTLPASHTIELTFSATAGAPAGRAVRDVGMPLARSDEAARGVPLAGVPVPVKDNVFLIGLANLSADVERNVGLLQRAAWLDVQMRFASGGRANLSFEKGVSGDRVLAEAFRQWEAAR